MNERTRTDKQHLRATRCSDVGINSLDNFRDAIDNPIGFPNAAPPWCRKYFARDLLFAMIEDRISRRHQSGANDRLTNRRNGIYFANKISKFTCMKKLACGPPRLDAWKLSLGGIRSICAVNFERGKIVLSRFIFSTA